MLWLFIGIILTSIGWIPLARKSYVLGKERQAEQLKRLKSLRRKVNQGRRRFQKSNEKSEIAKIYRKSLIAMFGVQAIIAGLSVSPILMRPPSNVINPNTSPKVIAPGDSVAITIEDGINALHTKLHIDYINVKTYPIKLDDGSEIVWKVGDCLSSKDTWDNKEYHSPFSSTVIKFHENKTHAWIKFKLPNDERLAGRTLTMDVHLKGRRPIAERIQHVKERAKNEDIMVWEIADKLFEVEKKVSLFVATRAQADEQRVSPFLFLGIYVAIAVNLVGFGIWVTKIPMKE